jgi:hypothetical protein
MPLFTLGARLNMQNVYFSTKVFGLTLLNHCVIRQSPFLTNYLHHFALWVLDLTCIICIFSTKVIGLTLLSHCVIK